MLRTKFTDAYVVKCPTFLVCCWTGICSLKWCFAKSSLLTQLNSLFIFWDMCLRLHFACLSLFFSQMRTVIFWRNLQPLCPKERSLSQRWGPECTSVWPVISGCCSINWPFDQKFTKLIFECERAIGRCFSVFDSGLKNVSCHGSSCSPYWLWRDPFQAWFTCREIEDKINSQRS